MTLDEGIRKCEGIAKTYEEECANWPELSEPYADARRTADIHKQLTEWLKELKYLREKILSANDVVRYAIMQEEKDE